MSLTRSVVGSVVSSAVSSVLGESGGGGGGGGPSTALAIVQAAYEAGDPAIYWDFQDLTSLSQDLSADATSHTAAANGAAIGTVFDKAPTTGYETWGAWQSGESITGSGATVEGEAGVSTATGGRPILRTGTPNYAEYDGADDNLQLASFTVGATPLMTLCFACRIDATDDRGYFFVDSSGGVRYAGRYRDAGSSVPHGNMGSPTYRVDGAALSAATQDDLHTAVADGGWHVVTIQAAAIQISSVWYPFGFMTSSVANDADLAAFCLLPDPSAEDLATIEADFASIVGVTLP